MEIGLIGLGKMGANMTERLLKGGHRVVAYDENAQALKAGESLGAVGADSLQALAGKLGKPRAVWCMVPAGDPTEQTVNALLELLAPGDIIVDGATPTTAIRSAGPRRRRRRESTSWTRAPAAASAG